MKVLYLNDTNLVMEECVVALGYFDGMHLGHCKLLDKCEEIASSMKLKKALMTFDASPKSILLNKTESYLMTLDDKKQFLEKRGFDYLFILPFDKQIAKLSATDFLTKYLMNTYMKHFVCGYDFHFGCKGAGDALLLQTMCSTSIISKYELDHHRVSTTYIKESLMNGDIDIVNQFLPSSYSIYGEVIYGKQRGKSQLGFATANVAYNGYILPKNGVYASKIILDDKVYYGMTNIGYNPTFGDIEKPSMEVHLFDFDDMIYGKKIRVSFERRIRSEMKFRGLQQLIEQLNKDQEECINYFN